MGFFLKDNIAQVYYLVPGVDFKLLSSDFRPNKKVLQCERKRHTARRVASARYALLVGDLDGRGGGVYPFLSYPHFANKGKGYTHPADIGTPTPGKARGTPP